MNSILSGSSERKSIGLLGTRPNESVETAGSLAMNNFHSLFEVNTYDMFSTSNPFSVDYSLYADYGESVAYSGFLSDFANAYSTISQGFSDGGFSGSFSSGGDCGFSGSCGGFTSVC